jgi:hypothetical protein
MSPVVAAPVEEARDIVLAMVWETLASEIEHAEVRRWH